MSHSGKCIGGGMAWLRYVGVFALGIGASLLIQELGPGKGGVSLGATGQHKHRKDIEATRLRQGANLDNAANLFAMSHENGTVNACPVDEVASITEDLLVYKEAEIWSMGESDSESLAPYLFRFFDKGISSLIIDVGANLGDTSGRFIELFSNQLCKRFQRTVPLAANALFDTCGYWHTMFLAVEPVPTTFDKLQQRAASDHWEAVRFKAVRSALSDVVPESGVTKFFGADTEGNQQGGLDAFSVGSQDGFDVPVTTLDHLISSTPEYAAVPIFLLKTDAEGFDGHILNGTIRLLKEKRIKFVISEWGKKWSYPNSVWTLKSAMALMESVGYQCYLASPTHMMPLFGRYWNDNYGAGYWANFICAQRCDPDLIAMVNYYNAKVLLPPGSCEC